MAWFGQASVAILLKAVAFLCDVAHFRPWSLVSKLLRRRILEGVSESVGRRKGDHECSDKAFPPSYFPVSVRCSCPLRFNYLYQPFSLSQSLVLGKTHAETRNESNPFLLCFSSVEFSRSVMSDSLKPHESQHARPPYPSPTPRLYSNSYPSSRWCLKVPNTSLYIPHRTSI